jgi:hypothetical protein
MAGAATLNYGLFLIDDGFVIVAFCDFPADSPSQRLKARPELTTKSACTVHRNSLESVVAHSTFALQTA